MSGADVLKEMRAKVWTLRTRGGSGNFFEILKHTDTTITDEKLENA